MGAGYRLAALHQTFASLQVDPIDGRLSLANSAMPVIVGVLQLVFGVLVGPFLLAFVGGWFGGEADPNDIRQAVAWSYVPHAVGGLFWIPVLIAFGGPPAGAAPQTALQWLATISMVLAEIGGLGWTLVLQVIALAEVQRFSIARALACIVILLIPVLLLAALR